MQQTSDPLDTGVEERRRGIYRALWEGRLDPNQATVHLLALDVERRRRGRLRAIFGAAAAADGPPQPPVR